MDSATYANLGISSASRLRLLMHDGTIENILQKFQRMNERKQPSVNQSSPIRQNTMWKIILSLFYNTLCIIPLLVHLAITSKFSFSPSLHLNWENVDWIVIPCMALMMVRAKSLATETVKDSFAILSDLSSVQFFKNSLMSTFDEVSALHQNTQADLRLSATASPSEGLIVSNFWVAHTSRR